jgi:hypothetical protein
MHACMHPIRWNIIDATVLQTYPHLLGSNGGGHLPDFATVDIAGHNMSDNMMQGQQLQQPNQFLSTPNLMQHQQPRQYQHPFASTTNIMQQQQQQQQQRQEQEQEQQHQQQQQQSTHDATPQGWLHQYQELPRSSSSSQQEMRSSSPSPRYQSSQYSPRAIGLNPYDTSNPPTGITAMFFT